MRVVTIFAGGMQIVTGEIYHEMIDYDITCILYRFLTFFRVFFNNSIRCWTPRLSIRAHCTGNVDADFSMMGGNTKKMGL